MLAHTLYLSHFQESQCLPEAVGGAHVHPTQGTEGAAGVVCMYYMCASVCVCGGGGGRCVWGGGVCVCICRYVRTYVCVYAMHVCDIQFGSLYMALIETVCSLQSV